MADNSRITRRSSAQTTGASTRASTKSAAKAPVKGNTVVSKPHAAARMKGKASHPRKEVRPVTPPPSSSPAPSSPHYRPAKGTRAYDQSLQKVKLAQKAAEQKRIKAIQDRAARMKAAEDVGDDDEPASPEADHQSDGEDEDEDDAALINTFGAIDPADDDLEEEDMEHEVPQEFMSDDEMDDNDVLPSFEENTEPNVAMAVDEPSNGVSVDESTAPAASPARSATTKAALDRLRKRKLLKVDGVRLSPSKSVSRRGALVTADGQRVYKVTAKMFTPRTRKLVEAGKRHARRTTTTVNAFPPDRGAAMLEAIHAAAVAEGLEEPFSRMLDDDDVQKIATTFVGYARGTILGDLASKARQFVTTFFKIPGMRSPPEVKDIVTFLLQDGHFKYGGVDVESQTFDAKRPFGTEVIPHLLRLEYFATRGGANILAFKEIVTAKKIRGTTIALLLTVVEHALLEYSEGTHRHSEFTDAARSRYMYHLSSYNKIATAAPTWAQRFETGLFTLALSQSNKSYIVDVAADDMHDVDVAALEADAIVEKSLETVSVTSSVHLLSATPATPTPTPATSATSATSTTTGSTSATSAPATSAPATSTLTTQPAQPTPISAPIT